MDFGTSNAPVAPYKLNKKLGSELEGGGLALAFDGFCRCRTRQASAAVQTAAPGCRAYMHTSELRNTDRQSARLNEFWGLLVAPNCSMWPPPTATLSGESFLICIQGERARELWFLVGGRGGEGLEEVVDEFGHLMDSCAFFASALFRFFFHSFGPFTLAPSRSQRKRRL